MAAASLGLGSHEAYTYPPPPSLGFSPDLALANNCAAMTTMSFPPPAAIMADDDYFPELAVQYTPDLYSPPPLPTPQAFISKNEMDMSSVDDGRRMVTAGNDGHYWPPQASMRIGFRTRSEVDVLDDGFKWRKYGKKAVKSSPNPRNYYRCSAEGCGVKKRVERDRHDRRYVVTTYDGVHNHVAPSLQQAAVTTLPPGHPSGVWGTMQQLHSAVAAAQSSESSY